MALIDIDESGSMILYQGRCPVDGMLTPLFTSEGEAIAALVNHIISHAVAIERVKIQVTPPPG